MELKSLKFSDAAAIKNLDYEDHGGTIDYLVSLPPLPIPYFSAQIKI
jgi:hypothetical protein